VVGLTKSTASELSAYGIRVNAFAPGTVLTPMSAGVRTGDVPDFAVAAERLRATSPLGFTPLALDVAQAALYLAGDEARFVSGHTLVVDGGQTVNGKVWNYSTGKSSGAEA
jgi:NAD(P)-dependent dehydrogenase (short-subunit alcohol dehydrogenase family)